MLYFLYFFIAHFTGDFLLQTNTIVKWKQTSVWGLLIHVLIIFFSTGIFFLPYLNSSIIWLALFTNSVVHFIIDYVKIKYEKKYQVNVVKSFLVDQLLHIITFSLLSYLLMFFNLIPYYFKTQWWFEYYEQVNFLIYISGFIIFSYTWDIFSFIWQFHQNKTLVYTRSYYLMIVRIFVYACLFIIGYTINKYYLHLL